MKQFLPIVLLILLHFCSMAPQAVRAQTCSSICTGTLGENIYPNGDFGAGTPNIVPVDPGFAPGYIYQTNPPPNDGYYTITNSTAFWGWFAADVWINIEDNGPEPNGYMMVVNAGYPPGMFFQNTVAVCENTLYEFSVDVINIFEDQFPQSIRPNLTFMIDNVAYCETGDIPIDEQWHTARFSFTTAPGQTSALLGMRNNAPGGYGNDIAIDNISFRACGPEVQAPDSLWFCPGNSVPLQVQLLNTPFPSTVYQWQQWLNGNWEDIPGANSMTWTVLNPQDGAKYRMLVASAVANLAVPNCRVVSEAITLVQKPALVLTTAAVDATCFGQSNGSVSALTMSGLAPYTYVWDNGNTNNLVTGIPAGNYQVTTTDAQGCTGSATVAVNEAPQLNSNMVSQPVSCFGGANGQAMVTATGGTAPYTYAWENGNSNNTIQGLPAGTYQLTITDAEGCTQTSSASIPSPSALNLQATTTTVSCFGGSDATAIAEVSGGTGPYTYAWNQGQSTAQIGALSAGNYTVTVTDANGCSSSVSSNIAAPIPLLAMATGGTSSCFGGNDAQANASASGGTGPYTFLWSTGQTSAQVGGLNAGVYLVTITDAKGCTTSVSTNIEEPTALSPEASNGATSCFGGNDASATASTSGGTGPYTYLWSGGQTSAQISGLAVGVYTVTITDTQGCTATALSIIQAPTLLSTNTMASKVSCFGGNDALASADATGGTNPYTFLWSNGQTSAQISGLTAGIYTVIATDAHGCTATQWVEVDQSPPLESNAVTVETSCFGGNDGSIGVQSSGGQAPYQYLWNNGQTTNTLSGLTAGTYGVTITDDLGCSMVSAAQVTEPTPIVLNVPSGAVSCFGGANGTLIATPSGGAGSYSMVWSNGQNGLIANNLLAGTYSLTATDTKGCTAIVSGVVTEPSVLQSSTTAQNVTCFGGNNGVATLVLNGGTPPYSYLWQGGQTNASANQLPIGNYQVTATDAQGCTQTGAVSIGQPSPVSGIAQATDATCYDSATGQAWINPAGGTPPYTFVWQNGQTTAQVNGLSAGWHTVNIYDGQQCQGNAQVWVGQPQPLLVDPITQPVSCPEVADGLALVSASGGVAPYQFIWSNGDLGAEIESLAAGLYSVTVTDAQGCTAFTEGVVGEASEIEVDLGLDQTLFLGEEIVLTAQTNLPQNEIMDYSWSGTGGALQCPDCFQYRFIPVESGCERVQVRSEKGCLAWDEMCFQIRAKRRIYVPNVFHPDDSGENDYFTIYSDASVKQILYLKIFSRWGEQVFQANYIQTNHEPSGWDGIFRGQPMNPAVFAWVAEVEFIDGEILFLKGDVTLVR